MPIASRRIVAAFGFCLLLPAACSAQQAPQNFGQVGTGRVVDFTRVGANQTEPLKVNEAIYQGIGFGNTFMVTTPSGNVIIDTSAINTRRGTTSCC